MDFPKLTAQQRMAAAKVSGSVQRLSFGRDQDLSIADKLAELHDITRDPVVFGHCLGDCLVDVTEQGSGFQACVDLLRAAGADEAAAAEKAAWRRDRLEQISANDGGFML